MNGKKINLIFWICYLVFIIGFSVYLVLDTFVISRGYKVVVSDIEDSNTSDKSDESNIDDIETEEIISTDSYYKDNNIEITLTSYREYDTDIYVADVKLKDASSLKTAFANDTYGKNITDYTSNIANSHNAILAINGDYYGVQEKGYVLKNGVIYRDKVYANKEDLVIYKDGSFEFINESSTDLDDLLNKGAYNLLSFGPVLINNSRISVTTSSEVDKSMASNPRTAIGVIDDLHYVFVVSDGRTSASSGLSLYELATFMSSLGVTDAYNLDGGGSSTLYFNGKVINKPTSNGKSIKERGVSDIVYIG